MSDPQTPQSPHGAVFGVPGVDTARAALKAYDKNNARNPYSASLRHAPALAAALRALLASTEAQPPTPDDTINPIAFDPPLTDAEAESFTDAISPKAQPTPELESQSFGTAPQSTEPTDAEVEAFKAEWAKQGGMPITHREPMLRAALAAAHRTQEGHDHD